MKSRPFKQTEEIFVVAESDPEGGFKRPLREGGHGATKVKELSARFSGGTKRA
jgi:hypothetical protein